MIACSQKVLEPLTRLQTLYGGNLYTVQSVNGPYHRWHLIKRADVESCLRRIEPLITVKREQVYLLLESLEVVGRDPRRKAELYHQMRALNKTRSKIPA